VRKRKIGQNAQLYDKQTYSLQPQSHSEQHEHSSAFGGGSAFSALTSTFFAAFLAILYF